MPAQLHVHQQAVTVHHRGSAVKSPHHRCDEVSLAVSRTIDCNEETLWVSTARKASARSSGVGNAATMSRVTLVAASGLTATGAKP